MNVTINICDKQYTDFEVAQWVLLKYDCGEVGIQRLSMFGIKVQITLIISTANWFAGDLQVLEAPSQHVSPNAGEMLFHMLDFHFSL